MSSSKLCLSTAVLSAVLCVTGSPLLGAAQSSSSGQSSSSAREAQPPQPPQEKAPSLVDPGGPTISLITSEQVFLMASALNACGYDEGLADSDPIRAHVRAEMNSAFERSEAARNIRDKICLYIAQHRMTGGERDISQYISLALYLSPPPELETSASVDEMPPDSTQVVEILPLLRQFVEAVNLHGIWLAARHSYDEETAQIHNALYKTILDTNLYLKMPFESYTGSRFIVVVEPMLSPGAVNARIYGTDYIVVVSPSHGQIRLNDVRHTYLHYLIEPLLYSRANAIDREQPILKEIREAPLAFTFRSNTVALTVECLIKAIEARTMNTGIPDYRIPAGVQRSELPRYEHEQQVVEGKQEVVREKLVQHDMAQGFVLTEYFYNQLLQFEKDPSSLKDTMGEMVYSMDIGEQVHRARETQFDQTADEDVLQRPKPRKVEGLDLAEARLEAGDVAGATALARQVLAEKNDSLQSVANAGRANFILARAALMTGHPDNAISDFQATLATSKNPRYVAWSHIYLGRMLDLDCKRDQALSEYKLALANRDGQQDTRLAAERGIKAPYAVQGHSCQDDSADDQPAPARPSAAPAPPPTAAPAPSTLPNAPQ